MSFFISDSRYAQVSLIFIVSVFFIGLGFYRNYQRYVRVEINSDIVCLFREKFIQWCNGNFEDNQLYMKIISESPQIQNLIGNWGVGSIRPPFANYIIHEWHIIINGIPTIRQLSQNYISKHSVDEYVSFVDEALLHSIGAFKMQMDSLRPRLKNPITLFLDGLTTLILIPVFILAECGLLTKKTYDWIFNSAIIKAITFLTASIAFISAIVGLVTGWKQFIEMLQPLLSRIGM